VSRAILPYYEIGRRRRGRARLRARAGAPGDGRRAGWTGTVVALELVSPAHLVGGPRGATPRVELRVERQARGEAPAAEPVSARDIAGRGAERVALWPACRPRHSRRAALRQYGASRAIPPASLRPVGTMVDFDAGAGYPSWSRRGPSPDRRWAGSGPEIAMWVPGGARGLRERALLAVSDEMARARASIPRGVALARALPGARLERVGCAHGAPRGGRRSLARPHGVIGSRDPLLPPAHASCWRAAACA